MKQKNLTGVIGWGLAVVLFGVVLHAPASVGLGGVFPDYAVGIKTWKEVVLGVLVVLTLIAVTRQKIWQVVLADRLVQLSLAFMVLHVVLALGLGGELRSIVAGLLIDLRFVVIFLLAYVVVRLRPQLLRRLLISTAAGAGVVLGFGLLQITLLPDDVLRPLGYSRQTITPYTTIDSNPDYVRINSTLRGPNPLGAMTVIYVALAFAFLIRSNVSSLARRIQAGVASVAGIAVLFASYSRSAYLAAVMAAAVIVASSVRMSKRLVVAGACAVMVTGATLAMVATTDWFSNVVLHEDPQSHTTAKSNDDHVLSLQTGLERTVTQPLGASVGSTGSASLYDQDTKNDIVIENQYFFIAHESGWLGLGVFMALFVLIMAKLWASRSRWTALGLFASGAGLAIVGLVLPVWADETVALTWWALSGAELAAISGIIGGRHDTGTRKQTSARAA